MMNDITLEAEIEANTKFLQRSILFIAIYAFIESKHLSRCSILLHNYTDLLYWILYTQDFDYITSIFTQVNNIQVLTF